MRTGDCSEWRAVIFRAGVADRIAGAFGHGERGADPHADRDSYPLAACNA